MPYLYIIYLNDAKKQKNTSHLSFIYSDVLNYLIYALKHIHKSFYIKRTWLRGDIGMDKDSKKQIS